MKILDLRNFTTIGDFYRFYENELEGRFEKEKAYSEKAKIKSSLVRYVLPKWGFPLKLEGNLSSSEMLDGVKFMEQIPIYQAAYLLEAQDEVFEKFGDRISGAIQRNNRSYLRKMVDWGRSQDWWKQSVEITSDGRTPTMMVPKKRVEHWHKLKHKELPPQLRHQLDALGTYMTTVRQPPLNDGSWTRYRREVLGVFGWMHRVKGFPLADLSLAKLVPAESIYNEAVAGEVVALAREYIEWMRANIGGKESTLKFPLQVFFYIAEYVYYEHTKSRR